MTTQERPDGTEGLPTLVKILLGIALAVIVFALGIDLVELFLKL